MVIKDRAVFPKPVTGTMEVGGDFQGEGSACTDAESDREAQTAGQETRASHVRMAVWVAGLCVHCPQRGDSFASKPLSFDTFFFNLKKKKQPLPVWLSG